MKLFLSILFAPLLLLGAQQLRIQLNWEPQFEFAGFYMAQELGYYKDAGIDVTLMHFDPAHEIDIKRTVRDKKADIGVFYSSIVADASQSGEFKLLSYLFQSSPFVALAKDEITKIHDGCLYASRNEYDSAIELLFSKFGIECRRPFDLEEFKNDAAGATTYIISNSAVDTSLYTVIDPKLYGYDMYDDIIFTSKEFYGHNKALVRRFVLATIKGWRYALRHIDESARLIHERYAPHKAQKELAKEARTLLEHAIFSIDTVGIFQPQKLQKMLVLFEESGILQNRRALYEIADPLFIDTVAYTFKERELIARSSISYSETTWPPFTIVMPNGKMGGMIEEYLELIRQKSGLELQYVPKRAWSEILDDIRVGKLDMAMATGKTPSRERYAVFSEPYGVYPFAIATKRSGVVGSIGELEGKRVAVGQNYTAHEILKKYKGLTVLPVSDTKKALELLYGGRVDAVVDIQPTLSYYIAQGYYKDIVISAQLPEKFALRAMFSKTLAPVVGVFNKALGAITPDERSAIERKYSSKIVYVVNTRKERYFKLFIALLLVVIGGFVFFAYRLKQELKRRSIAEEKLKKLANRDALTNLYNRRFFNTFIENELRFVKRYGGDIAFAIFDIDNFKSYNDLYGHIKGDEVLKAIANRVKEICKRESDFVFRLGGEEFGIYTRMDSVRNMKGYLEHFVEEVRTLGIEHRANTPYDVVTISLGAVVATVSPGSDITLNQIYKMADELMYEAKKEGKNRAVVRFVEL